MYRIIVISATLTTAWSSFVFAQSSPAIVGEYTFPPSIYRRGDVIRSLNLEDPQLRRLDELSTIMRERYRERIAAAAKLEQMESVEQYSQLKPDYMDDWVMKAKDVFTENQLTRYRQLQLQHRGFDALTDPEVQKRLDLSPEQRSTLRLYLIWGENQMREVNNMEATNPERGLNLYRQYQKEYREKLNNLLTPEQERAWRNTIGAPLDFRPGPPAP